MPYNLIHDCHHVFHWVIFPREDSRISSAYRLSVEQLCKGEEVGEGCRLLLE